VIAGPAAEAALAGDDARAEALLREAIAQGLSSSAGAVRLVDGAGPADLLTLRAARALAEADVLVIDPAADPGVVTLARRDASRLGAGEADASAMREAVAGGRQVVWITAPLGVDAVRERLGSDGIVTASP
jgi:precorrin-2 dehydrogenase/sirohydrochlorin ferrochelatase